MESDWVDFRTVKASITMQQVLDHYGIRLRKVNATYLRGKCPLPTHASKGSDDSFGVDLGKRAWACQSDSCVKARGGRRGGNVLEFVAVKEGVTVRDAALKLASWFNIVSPQPGGSSGDAGKQSRPPREEPPAKPADRAEEGSHDETGELNKPLTFALKGVDSTHPYLSDRGVLAETARLFDVGFFPGNGSMKGRIVFPIRNRGGDLLAYAGRSIDNSTEPRWKFPSGFRKSLELFGIHDVGNAPVVVLVESFWGVLALRQAGMRAVALMGRSMSQEQQALLDSLGLASIVILLDGDEPGRKAAPEIAVRLAQSHLVRIVGLPAEKQPDHLKLEELRALLAPCIIEPRT